MKPFTQKDFARKINEYFRLIEDIEADSEKLREKQVKKDIIDEYNIICRQKELFKNFQLIYKEKKLPDFSGEMLTAGEINSKDIEKIKVCTDKIKKRYTEIRDMI